MSPSPARRSFSDGAWPGMFRSLGVLPKRSVVCPGSLVFHIARDDDENNHSSSLGEHPTATSLAAVYFTSSESSPSRSSFSSSSPCSQLSRDVSSHILFANRKPLKSSLKSSSSLPAMSRPSHMHRRANSEPSPPKSVHFPEKDDGLVTVRVYNRSSPVNYGEGEVETEGDDATLMRFPSPPVYSYEIDPTTSSPVPSYSSSHGKLILESLNLSLSSTTSTKQLLTGSVLVRNLAFEKHVAIRFTLDDWKTVSEVGAHYSNSNSDLPSDILSSPPPVDTRARGWDRFEFTIHLEDYATSLSTRTIWLAARYRIHSTYPEPGSSICGPGGEWWDNNNGGNYRIGFRPATTTPTLTRTKLRLETFSAPISSRFPPQPPVTCKEHVLGLMVPTVSTQERHSMPLRAGTLDLCNYAPPTVRPPSRPSAPPLQVPSSSSATNAATLPLPVQRSLSDGESSPASSTLSTPSVSPTIIPGVIICGHPATYTNVDEEENTTYSKQGYVMDWSAHGKGRAAAS